MSHVHTRLSTSSALSDVLSGVDQYASFAHSPIYAYGPPTDSTESFSHPDAISISLHLRSYSSSSTTGGGGRSLARNLSLLSLSGTHGSRRHSGVFGEREYDNAFALEDQDGELERGINADTDADGKARTSLTQFQPLTHEELWWMIVSALFVGALTLVACLFTALS